MNIKGIFKGAFPFIATALEAGGPLGRMAANALGTGLGISVGPEDAEDALANATPEQMIALKKVEQDFQVTMATLGFDNVEKLSAIDAADRANARNRQIAIKDKLPGVLAMLVTAGFFGLLAMLSYHAVPTTSEKILDVMVGSLGTAWIGVINYYFGSSSGSAAKTALLAERK